MILELSTFKEYVLQKILESYKTQAFTESRQKTITIMIHFSITSENTNKIQAINKIPQKIKTLYPKMSK